MTVARQILAKFSTADEMFDSLSAKYHNAYNATQQVCNSPF